MAAHLSRFMFTCCAPTSCCSSGPGLWTLSSTPALCRPHHVPLGPACGLLQVLLLCLGLVMLPGLWTTSSTPAVCRPHHVHLGLACAPATHRATFRCRCKSEPSLGPDEKSPRTLGGTCDPGGGGPYTNSVSLLKALCMVRGRHLCRIFFADCAFGTYFHIVYPP